MVLYWILLPMVWVLEHVLWRVRVTGRENLPHGRGFVLAANHISDLDPVFVLEAAFYWRRLMALAKAELFHNPVFGFVLRCMGAVPIERGKGDTDTIGGVVERCRGGTGLLIFPEGTRSKNGQIGLLKSGAFVIAGQAGVDMVPCRIFYDTKDGRMHLFCRVRICFGKPIPAEALAIEDPKHPMAKLRECKQRLLAEWDALYEQNRF